MLKQRLNAAREVSELFLPLERDADRLAAASFQAVGRMMVIRAEANLGIKVGGPAIEKLRAAAQAAADARMLFIEAHAELNGAIDDAGIRSWYGDTDGQCLPTGATAAPPLSIVA